MSEQLPPWPGNCASNLSARPCSGSLKERSASGIVSESFSARLGAIRPWTPSEIRWISSSLERTGSGTFSFGWASSRRCARWPSLLKPSRIETAQLGLGATVSVVVSWFWVTLVGINPIRTSTALSDRGEGQKIFAKLSRGPEKKSAGMPTRATQPTNIMPDLYVKSPPRGYLDRTALDVFARNFLFGNRPQHQSARKDVVKPIKLAVVPSLDIRPSISREFPPASACGPNIVDRLGTCHRPLAFGCRLAT
jgi:hypothetical protein